MGATAFRMKSPETMVLDAASGVLRALPAERGHRIAVQMLRATGPLIPRPSRDDPRLEVDALGLIFPNPIGLAAGFDKDAEVPSRMLKLGFGFAECGTLTPRAQLGNPKPRIFRLVEDEAVINRLGFNNQGMMRAARRLKRRRGKRGIVGVNIGANKDSADMIADYMAAFLCLAPYASYMAVNISSPNTPGLRGLQDIRAKLRSSAPILLKIAPDLDDASLDDIAAVSMHAGIEGVIVSNTTVARPDVLKSVLKTERGGLSGAPLFGPSTAMLRKMRERTQGKLTLVGVGGVRSGADAYAKIRAGASLVQLYTALTYHGPGLVTRIKRELVQLLERDGFSNVTQAVGVDVDK
jgi:dihydroorotate dehydrogenase